MIPTRNLLRSVLAGAFATACALPAWPQVDPSKEGAPSSSITAKLMLRGDLFDVRIPEMRMMRRADVLVVETDFYNADPKSRTVYYRYRWLDDGGMQVGDGEPWKQLPLMGRESKVAKGIAPSSRAVDFRVEMNVDK